jgi:Cu(I)/Ag(I) efflux system membrane fusion protein
MKKLAWVTFLAGTWCTQRGDVKGDQTATRRILYYVDPMHPAYKSDKPGIAPDCGMELVPVYEDGSMDGAGATASGPPGTVTMNVEKQQLISVKADAASKAHPMAPPAAGAPSAGAPHD